MSKFSTAQPLNTSLAQILRAAPIGSKLSVERLVLSIRMPERTVRTAIRSFGYGRFLVIGIELCRGTWQTTLLANLSSEMTTCRARLGIPTNVAAS